MMIVIKNSDAANAVLKVWPATGDAINAIAANSALSMAAKTSALFVSLDGTTWYTTPLLPS
jgi:cobalamin biosynthesis protein CobD/CbiB